MFPCYCVNGARGQGFSLLCVLAEGRLQEVGFRGKQVAMRVQRRVRMGKKDEVGLPYILSPS